MDDLISRQDVIGYLTMECSWIIYDEHGQLTPNGKEILGTLKKIPLVDAVEVVRCKDCKHFAGDGMYCDNNILVLYDHFYCYYGERENDDHI